MTSYSLQDIIDVENEIQSTIQAEKQKCTLWLEKQKKEFLISHNQEIELLQKKLDEKRQKIKIDTEQRAGKKLQQAKEKVTKLQQIGDDVLKTYLKKHLFRIVTGDIP